MLSFNFNVSFSRADENHATTYRSGECITAESLERAWLKLGYRQHERADLRYTAVELHAILDEDGVVQFYRMLTEAEVAAVLALRAASAGDAALVADCEAALAGDAQAKGRVSWELQFAAIEADAKAAVCEHGYAQGCRACDPDGRG